MLKIAIRADASLLIGKGHIMRCLTLAGEIKKHHADANITFITTPYSGNLDGFISQQGFTVVSLPPPAINPEKNNTATWLGRTQKEDAVACQTSLSQHYDLLIVDHYAIDIQWHQLMRRCCKQLMVIDDLANRHYDCDILLDQTLSRAQRDYQDRTPPTCTILVGESYTLLREEFAKYRSRAIEKRQQLTSLPPNFHVLISLGGFDIENISLMAIHALQTLQNSHPGFTATLILSSQSKHLKNLSDISNSLPWLTLEIDCTTMALQMFKADIAIGASGATSWERCCLGLPTLSIQTAENQRLVNTALEAKGAILSVGTHEKMTAFFIEETIKTLILDEKSHYAALVKACFDTCNGKGANKVYKKLSAQGVKLRRAEIDDLDLVFSWQSNPIIRQYFRNSQPVTYDEHVLWYNKAIIDTNYHFYIITYYGYSAGLIRLDALENNEMEISILISPEFQGNNLASIALNKIVQQYCSTVILAHVATKNAASHKLFSRANFAKINENNYRLDPDSKQQIIKESSING